MTVPIKTSTRFDFKFQLMVAIRDHLDNNKITQVEAAELCGKKQSRISSLMNGEIDKFSVDSLIDIAESVGLSCGITIASVYKIS